MFRIIFIAFVSLLNVDYLHKAQKIVEGTTTKQKMLMLTAFEHV